MLVVLNLCMVFGLGLGLNSENSFNTLLSNSAILIGIVKVYADNIVAYSPHLVIFCTKLHPCNYW